MSRRAPGGRTRTPEDGRGQDGTTRGDGPDGPTPVHGWKYVLAIEATAAAQRHCCQEPRLVQCSWTVRPPTDAPPRCRTRQEQTAAPPALLHHARALRLVERARAWVEHNADDEALSVTALAAALHMSRTSLHRKLVASTGQPPGEFIRTVRLQLARRLLLEGSSNVSEAAYAVGFVSLSGFSRAYRSLYGEPPSSSRVRGEAANGRGRPAWNMPSNS